jgi:hypothetical protein
VILPQAPQIERVSYSNLESEAVALGVRFSTNARDLKGLSRDLYLNYQAWLARTDALAGTIDGYAAWLDELDCGIPRTSLWRRLRVGFALKHGASPDWSDEDLIDAGALLENGQTLTAVQEAVATNQVARKAEAARNKGVLRVPIPDKYAQIRRELCEQFKDVLEPELTGLALQFAHTFHKQFAEFVAVES